MNYTYEICIYSKEHGYTTKSQASIMDSSLTAAQATVESKLPAIVTDRDWVTGEGEDSGQVNNWLIIQTEPGAIIFLWEEGYACIGCGAHHPEPNEPEHTDKDGHISYGGCIRCGDVLYNSVELANEWTPKTDPDLDDHINIERRCYT